MTFNKPNFRIIQTRTTQIEDSIFIYFKRCYIGFLTAISVKNILPYHL